MTGSGASRGSGGWGQDRWQPSEGWRWSSWGQSKGDYPNPPAWGGWASYRLWKKSLRPWDQNTDVPVWRRFQKLSSWTGTCRAALSMFPRTFLPVRPTWTPCSRSWTPLLVGRMLRKNVGWFAQHSSMGPGSETRLCRNSRPDASRSLPGPTATSPYLPS